MTKKQYLLFLTLWTCHLTAATYAPTQNPYQQPSPYHQNPYNPYRQQPIPTLLSEQDIEKILLSSTNMDKKRAKLLVKQLKKQYGKDQAGKLNISAVLVGYKHKWSHAFFIDHDTWEFDTSFIPEGSQQVITVPKLVHAEISNPGLGIKLLNKECFLVFVPKGLSLAQLNGFKTNRGCMFDILQTLLICLGYLVRKFNYGAEIVSWLLPSTLTCGRNLGLASSTHGTFYLCNFRIGLGISLFSFPQLTFRVVPPGQQENPTISGTHNPHFMPQHPPKQRVF